MVRVDLELEGEAEDVVRGLRRIVGGAGTGTVVPELGHILSQADEVRGSAATTVMPPPVPTWTEAEAADFVAGLGVAARRVVLQVSGGLATRGSTAVRCAGGPSCLRRSCGGCW